MFAQRHFEPRSEYPAASRLGFWLGGAYRPVIATRLEMPLRDSPDGLAASRGAGILFQ